MLLNFLMFMLIALSLGFGIGYWLLIASEDQPSDSLRITGTIFGWTIILTAILITITGLFSSINEMEHRAYLEKVYFQQIQTDKDDQSPFIQKDEMEKYEDAQNKAQKETEDKD